MPRKYRSRRSYKSRYSSRRKSKARYTGGGQRYKRMKRTVLRTLANRRTGGFLGIEYKFLDCSFNSLSISASTDATGMEMQPSAGCTGCISVPAQGDSESERDGRQYTLKSCFVSGTCRMTTNADEADPEAQSGVFVALVLDTQANGATIDSEKVFSTPSTVASAMLPIPLRNLQYSKRFKVLDSKYIPAGGAYAFGDGANTGSVAGQQEMPFTLSWKGNIVCDSSGTTANVSAAADNALHVLMTQGGPYAMTFAGKSRVRFVG